jgi:hypothetical protein
MSGYDNIKGKGNRFSSTNQPKNPGRKPRLYTVAKKAYGISYEEFKAVSAYLMQLPKADLERILSDENTPMWVLDIGRSLHKDTAKGSTRTLNEIADRLWGKAETTSKIDMTTNGKDMISPPSVNVQVVTADPSLLELQDKAAVLRREDE